MKGGAGQGCVVATEGNSTTWNMMTTGMVSFFPDVPDGVLVDLGTTVRALIRFHPDRWEQIHSRRITVGMAFEIREGARVVGRGVVTRVNPNASPGERELL